MGGWPGAAGTLVPSATSLPPRSPHEPPAAPGGPGQLVHSRGGRPGVRGGARGAGSRHHHRHRHASHHRHLCRHHRGARGEEVPAGGAQWDCERAGRGHHRCRPAGTRDRGVTSPREVEWDARQRERWAGPRRPHHRLGPSTRHTDRPAGRLLPTLVLLPAPPAPAAVETKHKRVQTAECMALGFFVSSPRARLVARPGRGVGRLRTPRTRPQAPGREQSRPGRPPRDGRALRSCACIGTGKTGGRSDFQLLMTSSPENRGPGASVGINWGVLEAGHGQRSSCPGAAWNPGFTTRLSPEGSSASEVSACSRRGQFLLLRHLGVSPRPLPPSGGHPRRAPSGRHQSRPCVLTACPATALGMCSRGWPCAWTAGGSSPELRPRPPPPKPPPGSGSGCKLCSGREREPAQKAGDPTTTASSLEWLAPSLPRCPHPRCQGWCRACALPHGREDACHFCGTNLTWETLLGSPLPPPGCQRSRRWSQPAPPSVPPPPTAPVPVCQLPPVPAVRGVSGVKDGLAEAWPRV